MGSSKPDEETFSKIWQTHQLEEGAEVGYAETRTMKPSAQTRITTERGEPFVENLPPIRQVGQPGGTMPEVELKGMIGEGGTAQVVAADQIPLGREVAVKKLRENGEIDESMYVLLQEAWVTGRLEHPNVVPVYRLGRDDQGDPVIVMKRIEGVSWQALLEDPEVAPREFDSDDPLDWHLDILMDVCEAVHYAHSNEIIHRDLKPANVMIGAFGEVYVLDWGLAVTVGPEGAERLPSTEDISEPAGTPAYMAPEMAEGNGRRHGVQTDVYLLGAILHRIVTGQEPHGGESMFEVMYSAYESAEVDYGSEVPARLAEICRRAMARKPEERFASAEAFRRELVEFQKRRQSLELSRQARRRLEEFDELVAGEEEPEEAEVYELFGECRFGFEQALQVDEQNANAREGLQAVMEQMIEREIDREGYKAASLLIADLPDERPELEERVEQLLAEQADREEEYEKLKEFERERDVERGRKTRSIFVASMGVILGTMSYVPGVMQTVVGFDLGYGDLLVQSMIIGLVIVGGLWIGRRDLFQNAANKKLVGSLLWVFGGILTLRKASMQTGIAMESAMSYEMLLSSVACGIIGVCLDYRLFWAAIPYFLGGILTAEFAEYAPIIDGLTDVVALGLLAIAWWPDETPEKLTPWVGGS